MTEQGVNETGTDLVLILLSEHELPKLLPVGETLGRQITLNGSVYKDADVSDWLGFYDWLRSESGELLGVRLWLDEPYARLLPLAKCVNVTIDDARQLIVFFGTDRAFDPEASNDQDFGGNMLFSGIQGYALTFFAPAM